MNEIIDEALVTLVFAVIGLLIGVLTDTIVVHIDARRLRNKNAQLEYEIKQLQGK